MDIYKACKKLISTDPFYGMFMITMDKEYSTDIDTAGVAQCGINLKLKINESWWNTLTEPQQLSILKHECLHICFGHLWVNMPNKELANIAMDLEINQYLDNLPPGGYMIEKMFPEWPKKAGFLEYYKRLQEESQQEYSGFDDHSNFGEFGETEAEEALLKSQITSTIKEVAEQASKIAGTVPGEITGILKLLKNKPAIFNWKKYFRRLIGNSIITFIAKTRYKPSKRFEDSPGLKLKQKPKILVAVDTSGSISDKDLSEFFSEIYNIYKTGIEITVIEFDTKINNMFKFTGKQDIKISGRGGTDCYEAIQYYKQHGEYSSLVIFTDGYLELNHLPKVANIIWCITPGGSIQQYPGKTIYIPKYANNA